MFPSLRQLSEAVSAMVKTMAATNQTLEEIQKGWEVHGPLKERLEALERDRDTWEAQMEAELLRVQSAFKAARNAEERTRTMTANARAAEGGDEGEEEVGAEYLELLRRNAEAGADEALRQVPEVLAVDAKTRALQAKFGVAI